MDNTRLGTLVIAVALGPNLPIKASIGEGNVVRIPFLSGAYKSIDALFRTFERSRISSFLEDESQRIAHAKF